MNIYLLEQNRRTGYDTYDSAVVVAESPELAVRLHPNGMLIWDIDDERAGWRWDDNRMAWPRSDWPDPSEVTVQLLGRATLESTKRRVICASCNTG